MVLGFLLWLCLVFILIFFVSCNQLNSLQLFFTILILINCLVLASMFHIRKIYLSDCWRKKPKTKIYPLGSLNRFKNTEKGDLSIQSDNMVANSERLKLNSGFPTDRSQFRQKSISQPTPSPENFKKFKGVKKQQRSPNFNLIQPQKNVKREPWDMHPS